jgi:hypothetical protein
MRRLIALLLIASSGWLLVRTGVQFVDIKEIDSGLEQPVWNGSWRFWENDLQLGVAMLVLAAAASILGRD